MAYQTKITASPDGYEVTIEREFDAPIEKLWKAYTDPNLVIQWMGPRDLRGKIDIWELKPGGKWGYTHTRENESYSFYGYYHAIDEPKHLVCTFEYGGAPGHVSLNSVFFEDLGSGKTKVKSIALFEAKEDRRTMIQSGMEKGVIEGNERLDELLTKMQQ